MSKVPVAVVSPFVDKRHGTERCLAEQIERLAGEYEIHLFSSRVDDVDLSRITWHRVPELPGPHLVKYLFWFAANHYCRWRVQRRCRRPFALVYSPGINCLDADIIQVHIVFSEFYRYVHPALKLGRNPLRSWPALIHRRLYYGLIIWLEGRVYRRSDVSLVGISRKTGEDLQRIYGTEGPVPTAFHGTDPARFHPGRRERLRPDARSRLGLEPDDFAVLLVGNDWKRKGLDCLLKAMRKVAQPRMKLLIRGKDNPALYRHDWTGTGGVPVALLPEREDMEFYYAAADLLVAPSLEDTFSMPPLEAMASGLPVIVSRKAGVSEIVTHGIDALILENPIDAEELAQLLAQVLQDTPLRMRLSRNGAETAKQFTWDANAKQMAQLFGNILSRNRRQKDAGTRNA